MKLTAKQRTALERIAQDKKPMQTYDPSRQEKAGMTRTVSSLRDLGLITGYGFTGSNEITKAGRAVLEGKCRCGCGTKAR